MFEKRRSFILRMVYISSLFVILCCWSYYQSIKLNLIQIPNKFLYCNRPDTVTSCIEIDTTRYFTITYKLKGTIKDPYAGVGFLLNQSTRYSFDQFDAVSITIQSADEKIIPVIYSETIDDLKKDSIQIEERNWTYDLNVKPGTFRYSIPLSSFKVIFWWFNEHKISMKDLPEYDPKRVSYVAIQSDRLLGKGLHGSFTIKSFYLKKTINAFWFLIPVFLMLFTESYLFLKKRRPKVVEIKPLAVIPKEHEDEWQIIKTAIAQNYHAEELNLDYLQQITGIQKIKISQLIKTNLNLNFKQYINQLRIYEASRLLDATDLNISEIAYKVGFLNISHFNRVFKELKSCSPTHYRNHLPTDK